MIIVGGTDKQNPKLTIHLVISDKEAVAMLRGLTIPVKLDVEPQTVEQITLEIGVSDDDTSEAMLKHFKEKHGLTPEEQTVKL